MKTTSWFILSLCILIQFSKKNEAKPASQLARGCRAEDGFFLCSSKRYCIYRGSVKTANPVCPDGSDEIVDPLQCSDDEVRCRATKRCVARRFMNTPFGCQISETINIPCRSNEFQCDRSRICIPRWMVGDGQVDCNSTVLSDGSDEIEGFEICRIYEFRCEKSIGKKSRCIPRDWVKDGYNDCANGTDEKVALRSCFNQTEFRCRINGRCIPRYRVFDGYGDCLDWSDETRALPACITDKEFKCTDSGRCIPRSWRGNSLVNCKDGSDENPMHKNESCVEGEFRCHNDRRCIPTYLLCDGMDHCGDCSDEIESCDEPRMFRCPSEPEKCIYWGHSCDTFSDCANGTDDIKVMSGFKCRRDHTSTERYCSIPQWMLHDDFSNCDDDSDLCLRKNSTSTCIRCMDEKTVLATRQICDGIVDCPDFSDECLCSQGRTSNRVRKFCEKVSYTNMNPSCPVGSVTCSDKFKCLKPSMVCDGKVDCISSSLDEDVCTSEEEKTQIIKKTNFQCDPLPAQLTISVPGSGIEDLVKNLAPFESTRCDGITECLNFEDECSTRSNCSNRLPICDALPSANQVIPPGFYGLTNFVTVMLRRCKGFLNFAFGKSICNGVLECEDGIDERNCSARRFVCDAGTTDWPTGQKKVVSISLEKRCDAKLPTDCVDQSDEINCTDATHFYCENGDPLFVKRSQVLDGKQDCSDYSDECPKNVFSEGGISSREDLIKSSFLQFLVWIMAFFATFGNASVAFIIFKKFYKRRKPTNKKSKVAVSNDLMILNLSVADFLMGVVLFCIAVRSQLYKGRYCLVDKVWRTSTSCTALGVVTVLSSQCSVFTLVVLSSYRLVSVLNPMNSQQIRLRFLYVILCIVWLVSSFIALLPLSSTLANSMITKAWITPSPYFPSDTVSLGQYQEFAKRVTALGSSLEHFNQPPTDWYGIEQHLRSNFSNIAPTVKGYFGYYGESGVCIPRLYLTSKDDRDHNPMTFVVMTFNFAALLYIAIVYLIIYRRSTANKVSSSASNKKSSMLQRKITLLIATDVTCWFPLCFMTFLSMGKIILPPIAYALSAIVFLPINSSLNPIIYTNPFSILEKHFRKGLGWLRARLTICSTDQEACSNN